MSLFEVTVAGTFVVSAKDAVGDHGRDDMVRRSLAVAMAELGQPRHGREVTVSGSFGSGDLDITLMVEATGARDAVSRAESAVRVALQGVGVTTTLRRRSTALRFGRVTVQFDVPAASDVETPSAAEVPVPVGVAALIASGRVQPATVSVTDLPPPVACSRSTADVLEELRSDW